MASDTETYRYVEDFYHATNHPSSRINTYKIYHQKGEERKEVIGYDVACEEHVKNKSDKRWPSFLSALALAMNTHDPLANDPERDTFLYHVDFGHLIIFEKTNRTLKGLMAFIIDPTYSATIETALSLSKHHEPTKIPYGTYAASPHGPGF